MTEVILRESAFLELTDAVIEAGLILGLENIPDPETVFVNGPTFKLHEDDRPKPDPEQLAEFLETPEGRALVDRKSKAQARLRS